MLLVGLTHYSTIQLDYPDHTEARQFKLHARIVIDVYLVEQTTLTQEQSPKLKGEFVGDSERFKDGCHRHAVRQQTGP